jgi:stage III sporulation protein SpoIIIAA
MSFSSLPAPLDEVSPSSESPTSIVLSQALSQPASEALPHLITDNLDELLAVLPADLRGAVSPQERATLIEIVLDLGRRPEARFAGGYKYLRESPITSDELAHVEKHLGTFGDDNRAGIPATLHRISAIRNRRGTVVGLTLRVGRAVSGIVDILRDLIASGQSVLLMGRPGLGKTTLLREMARVLADEENRRVVIVDTSNEIAGDGDVPHPAIGRARRMQVARVSQQHDVMIEAVENHMPEVVVIDEIGRVEEALAARTIAERGVQLIATVHGNTLDNLLNNPSMSDLIGGIGSVTLSDEEARRRGTQKTVLERKAPPTFDVVVEMVERGRIAVRRPIDEVVDALLRGAPLPAEIRFRGEDGRIHVEQAPEQAPRESHNFDMRSERPASRERPGDRRKGREGRGRDGRAGEARTRTVREDRGGRLSPLPAGPSTRDNGEEPFEAPAATRVHRWEAALTSEPASIQRSGSLRLADRDEADDDEQDDGGADEGEELDWNASEGSAAVFDPKRVRRLYPFSVSRSRLTRAIKQLGLEITLSRSWHDADAVLMLSGGGVSVSSSLLREARELGLPIVSVRGNTYAQILARLNDLFADLMASEGGASARELAVIEARNAAQRVMSQAEPVDLRPQSKTVRRIQHQLAERFHLRSYSVGREPHRRVRFLPGTRR